jgi:hypothetical protein
MSRLILIIVLGGFITYSIISMTQNKNVTQATENSVDNYAQTKVRNVANSTVQLLMSQVADDYSWRATTPVTKQIFDGEATYTVTDGTFDGEDLIKFSVTANMYDETKKITVYAKPMDPYAIGVNAPSPVSTNNNILTLGNITIDGRDHTADGTVVPGEGTCGIWTTKTYTPGGASKIGGTYDAVDYKPSKTPDPSIIAENQTWPGATPTTPEQVITNLPNGFSLKEYAQSGDWGSQYVTDPKNLTYPLGGVTYVELPTSGSWDAANIEGSGILIVHNDNVNAVLQNTKNNFTGLIIADDIIHLHSDIIGAVVSLTENPSGGNTIGNSSGSILYSKQVLDNTLMSIRPRNYGFAQNRLYVKHWFE